MSSIGEFLTGLSGPDTLAVAADIALYGNSFVERGKDGKRRIPVGEWPAIVERHNARPISDGVPGMTVTQ